MIAREKTEIECLIHETGEKKKSCAGKKNKGNVLGKIAKQAK
jgi:hypothetical protein